MKTIIFALFAASNIVAIHSAMAAEEQQIPETQKHIAVKLKLPLDHGPRAEVTPWVNQQRRLRAEQAARAELAKSESSGDSQIK